MDIDAELRSISERTHFPRVGDVDWCRPVEIGMSVGVAVRALTKKAVEAGYTKMEISMLLAELAEEMLQQPDKK
ncbi:hypothetical protein [Rhizobium sp. RU36D]|uniref:hypothetical protein n=1 Tax=Rhizobium sp. RU36D TaxID=1907415 RepID=UPI0009D79D6F|nr:hypothetical protein [Rhizobium sp. RU36D]SMC47636.1 hypothetical protein SAMN05880593_101578 [Rhizobium sp. RU36D]